MYLVASVRSQRVSVSSVSTSPPAQRTISRTLHPSRRHTTANPSVASHRSANLSAAAARFRARFAIRRSCASMISRSTGSYRASHADKPSPAAAALDDDLFPAFAAGAADMRFRRRLEMTVSRCMAA